MGTLVFQATLGGSVNLIGPNTASTINFTLPSADGTSGQALTTNGSGTLSFATVTTGAAGSTTQVQYNSSGAFAGSANLTFNGTTLTAANTSITTSETLSYGTANGVTYLNGSKVLTSGSALTFDGTTLKATTLSNGIELKQLSAGSATYYVMDNTIETGGKRWRFGYSGAAGIPTFSLYNATDGVTSWIADSAGNLGLNVTPSAYSSETKAIDIGAYGVSIANTAGYQATYANNAYYNAGWKYKATGYQAALYTQNSGTHAWATAGSGTAGNAISFTQAMALDASGNLGIGTTSPLGRLHIETTSGSAAFFINSPSATDVGSYISLRKAGSAKFLMGVESTLGGTSDNGLLYVYGANALTMYTNGSERARIDSSGNLLVGTTTNTPAQSNVSGFKVGGGQIECNGSNTQAAFFGRSNDGQVVRFYNAGSAAGNISNTSTVTTYNGTSDYRLKENIQPMEGGLEKILALKPVTYTWKNDGRLGQGFIAHELQEVIPDAVQGEKDAIDEDGNPEYQGIDPRMVVATLTAAIQEQQAIIQQLQADVAALKGN